MKWYYFVVDYTSEYDGKYTQEAPKFHTQPLDGARWIVCVCINVLIFVLSLFYQFLF